ncbi:MAG TPA: PAS domain-containing protein [Cyanobacteria bacterium UBA8803]|nr:PAS domain-containing protein [Cyanobacteria bacterium UBA9273]HBL61810.1 PAS domain-containing protein [Cyanobacteria bacterium UBA8803]
MSKITEPQKALEGLQDSQHTLATLISNLPGMAYRRIDDRDWTCKFVSAGCYELTGYQPQDLINNRQVSYRQIIYPEDRGLVQREVISAIKQGHPFQAVYRIVARDGVLKWVWEQGRGIFDSEGNLLAIEGFITDITARKQAEEKVELLLRISQAISCAPDFHSALEIALRQVCETTGWIYGEVWLPAADGSILECSRSWYRQRSGIAPSMAAALDQFREYSQALRFVPGEELPGRVWYQVQPEWVCDLSIELDDVFPRLKLAAESGLKAAFAVPIVAASDPQAVTSRSPVLAVLVFFMLEGHSQEQRLIELVSAVFAQLGTVMQQKKAEAEMKALFAAMTDIVLVMDASGRCLNIAPTNSVNLYKPLAQMNGKTLQENFPEAQAELILSGIREALFTQQTVRIEYSLTIEARDIWFAASLAPVGEDLVIWAARDISESKLLEEKLRSSESKMRLFFEAMTDIVLIVDVEENAIVNIEVAPTNPTRLYPRDIDPIGKTIEQFFSDERAEAWISKIQQALDTRQTINFDYALSAGQDEIWFSASISPISDHSIIWMARDITARKQAEEGLRIEQEKSERLLLNVLPEFIANRLKQDQRPLGQQGNEAAIAEHFEDVTILFADIVGFTPLSARLGPLELVNLLNQIFSTFDQLAQRYGLEKIKTIGDAYMVVGGLPMPMPNHAEAIAQMALDMQQAIHHFQAKHGESFEIRIGINTGSVVAGVIGIQKFIYDLWGDAVNVASRMESSGVPGKIQVTATTYERLQDKFEFEPRGAIAVKGKGEMMTYWLTGTKIVQGGGNNPPFEKG